MRALPAVDLREGACVQLVGGAYEAERVRLDDPAAVCRRWQAFGFSELHVVDLDAATGRGDNAALLAEILRGGGTVQVGGGVRDEVRVETLLGLGAARVVVGTRAIEDRPWLARTAARFPGKLVVAADVRGREVVTRGWAKGSGLEVGAFLRELEPLPLAAVLVTAVHQEGRLQGTDLALMAELAAATRHPLQASGGVPRIEDVREIQARGVASAILGMALYTQTVDPARLAEEFGR
jgi:phosphoribosylformimino-5-aminoimidazole carboxamide ribotide isomerase